MWKPFYALALVLLLGACSTLDAVKPKLDDAYDKALAAWCVLPPATHVRAISRRSITPRSLTDNCPAWRAIRDAMIGGELQRLGIERRPD